MPFLTLTKIDFPHACLVELAGEKQLPYFQFMDAQTLRWIEAHRNVWPYQRYDTELFCCPFDDERSPLRNSWFCEPKIIDGLHGMRHALRVAIYANILASQHGLPEKSRLILVLAALLHDVQRLNDQEDFGHGARAADWIMEHAQHLPCLDGLSREELRILSSIVRWHDVSADEVPVCDVLMDSVLLDLLKTAAALDRYRLPKITWWIDENRLAILPSHELKAFVFDLILASEWRFLEGENSFSAVISGMKDLVFPG